MASPAENEGANHSETRTVQTAADRIGQRAMISPARPINKLIVEAGIATDRGRRMANEDFAGCVGTTGDGSRGVAAAIADGVGGAKGGRVAAELAVRGFLDAFESLDPLRGVKRNAIAALDAINGWVHAQGTADPLLDGMACTFSALILRGRLAHVTHVGDSRLYRLREDELTRLTHDHVPTRGAVRNILTRALGAEADLRVDYTVEAARESDRYLLCTDGVHGALSDRTIGAALRRRSGPRETADRLVQAAIDARLGDNATALVIDVIGLPEADRLDLGVTIDALPILPAPRSGAAIDGYRLNAMLSDGRYSRVFAAIDEASGRAVIVKFPKPAVGAEPVLRQAFLREAWIATRLSSPWVAEVIEDATDRRTSLYTVMPFYEGETLERRLRRRPPVSRSEGLAIADKLAKAVAALHRAGVIHRDVKPDNVILTGDGGLKLIDLGVARLPNMEDFPGTDTPGTPSYMAPELLAGAAGDEKTDLYALGVTIYRMFTGAYPYGEVEPFSKPRFTRPPASMLTHRPDLPAWLDRTIERAIAIRPEDRFDDAIELIFALEHGALHAAPSRPRHRPLLERDPLRFWQMVAVWLVFALMLSWIWK